VSQYIVDDRLILNTGDHPGFTAAPWADTSMLNTRFKRCAQRMAWWRCAGVFSSFSCFARPLPRLAGVTSTQGQCKKMEEELDNKLIEERYQVHRDTHLELSKR
jgi:hypothetical protein